MRKILFSLLLMIAVMVIPASAEQFGVKAGVNIASLAGEYLLELKSLTAFRFGGYFVLDLGGGLQLQPEAYYAQKGASYEDSYTLRGVTFTLKGKLKLDYIEVPVLFKYTLKGDSVRPFFYAGPYIGFKASAKGEVTVEAGDESETESEDMEDVKSTDFGVVFGAGVNIPLGQMDLIFDARYALGLTNISDELDESVKNGVISIMAGIGF